MHINNIGLDVIETAVRSLPHSELRQNALLAIDDVRDAVATDEQLDLGGQAWRNIEGIQIDDDAGTSQTDTGFWLQGWLWVDHDDEGDKV